MRNVPEAEIERARLAARQYAEENPLPRTGYLGIGTIDVDVIDEDGNPFVLRFPRWMPVTPPVVE